MDFVSFCVGLAVGVVGYVVLNWELNRRALSIVRRAANAKGRDVQAAQNDDLFNLLAEVKQAHDQAVQENPEIKFPEFAAKYVPAIAMRHPVTALKYGKRLYGLLKSGSAEWSDEE